MKIIHLGIFLTHAIATRPKTPKEYRWLDLSKSVVVSIPGLLLSKCNIVGLRENRMTDGVFCFVLLYTNPATIIYVCTYTYAHKYIYDNG